MSTPLAGVRVVVTRAKKQADGLVRAFEEAGAQVERLPLLEIVPPQDPKPLERACTELGLYDWLVLTSANAVEAILERTGGALPSRIRTAVVGDATARALEQMDLTPTLTATPSHAAGLLDTLRPHLGRQQRLLLPQAEDADPVLARGLRAAGAEAVAIVAYSKRLPSDAHQAAHRLFSDQPLGWITFTSGSTARNFIQVLGDNWATRRGELLAASIGPLTSAELRRHSVVPAAEARHPDDGSLVKAVEGVACENMRPAP